MFKLNVFYLLFFIFLNVNCDKFEKRIYFDTIRSDENVFAFYYPDIDKYLNLIDLIINEPINITDQCINELKILNNSLAQKEEWALKVYESNGKPKPGYLSGLNHDLGNLDLCVFSELNKYDNQFCLISLRSNKLFEKVQKERKYKEFENSILPIVKDVIDFNFGTVIGTCLPLSCNINNILSIINKKVLKDYDLEAIAQKHCTYLNDTTFNTPAYYISWAIIILLSTLSISTLFLDINFLKPFSIRDNLSYIYCKESTSTEKFLSGFKVLYIVTSLPAHYFGLSHMFGFYSFSSDHIKEINLHFNWLIVDFLERITMGVDLMFFYGGFMVFLLFFDKVKNKKVNFFQAIIFWPIANWPILIGFISVCFAFLNLFHGPFLGDTIQAVHTLFFEKAWKIFTFLSNTDYLPEQVILHNWFNSVSFHLFIIFYFVLHVFAKNEKLGLIVSSLIFFLNIIYSGYLMINQNIPPFTHLISGDSIYFADFGKDYLNWYNHLDAYLVGFITGYLYKNNKVSYLKNSFIYYSLLIITTGLFSSVFTIPMILSGLGLSDNIYCQLFYFTLKRFFFALSPSFVFLSFKAGYLGMIRKILSWNGFTPLSRLASSIIACQFLYFFYWYFTRRDLIRFTFETLFKEGVYVLVITFLIANVFYLIIEAPITNIIRQITLSKNEKNRSVSKKDIKLDIKTKDLNDNKVNEKDLNFNTSTELQQVN